MVDFDLIKYNRMKTELENRIKIKQDVKEIIEYLEAVVKNVKGILREDVELMLEGTKDLEWNLKELWDDIDLMEAERMCQSCNQD